MPLNNPSKSFQISSNTTLFFKLALPIFWTVFFGAFTVSALNTPMHGQFKVSPMTFKISVILFFLSGVLFLFFTFWKLKRVEFYSDHFFVTNFFKHVNLGYKGIESISLINIFIVKLMVIKLSQKGHFGRRLPLIVSRKRLRLFMAAHPELSKQIGL